MIKKFLIVLIALSSCTTVFAENKTLTQKMLKPMLISQCYKELDQSKIWSASTFLLDVKLKQSIADQVCECVGDHALNNIKASELAKSMISEDAKNKVIKQAVINSVSICVPKLIR